MRFLIIALTLMATLASTPVLAAQKLESTDDRIKTLVFDPSEVYRVVTRAGFQTTIEFNTDESIDTISIGDSIGWQLTPSGKRLFVKPLHKSGITNLSVITSRRSYQFELVATSSTSLSSTNAYVIKFYYPESTGYVSQGFAPAIMPQEQTRANIRPVSPTAIPQLPQPVLAPQPVIQPAQLPGDNGRSPFTTGGNLNYNYTMTGPDSVAPVKIFDNGRSTFFQFGNTGAAPRISVIGTDGQEFPLSQRSENGMVVVDAVAPKMNIRSGKDTVTVYNESKPAGY